MRAALLKFCSSANRASGAILGLVAVRFRAPTVLFAMCNMLFPSCSELEGPRYLRLRYAFPCLYHPSCCSFAINVFYDVLSLIVRDLVAGPSLLVFIMRALYASLSLLASGNIFRQDGLRCVPLSKMGNQSSSALKKALDTDRDAVVHCVDASSPSEFSANLVSIVPFRFPNFWFEVLQ